MAEEDEILRGVYPECNEWAQDDTGSQLRVLPLGYPGRRLHCHCHSPASLKYGRFFPPTVQQSVLRHCR